MSSSETSRPRDVTPEQKSALLLLFVTFFIDIVGVGIILPLGPYYVQKYPLLFGRYISAGLAVGALTALYPTMQLIFSPFWGRLSDRVGRRPIILLSLFGNGLAWCLFGVAHSLEVLFLARIISGILSGASLPTINAYIADSTPPEKRSVWIGIVVGMGFSFGFILGPLIGGVLGTSPWPGPLNAIVGIFPHGHALITANHLSYPAFLAAIIAFSNFAVAFRRLPETLTPELREAAIRAEHGNRLQQLLKALTDSRIAPLLIILGLSTFAMQNLEQTIILYGNKDVTSWITTHSWSTITPALVKGRAVYSIQYSPDTPPTRAESARILPVMNSVVPDPSLQSQTIVMKRHLVEEDTSFILFVVALVVGLIQGGGLRKMIPRLGETRLIALGTLIAGIGFLLVPEIHTFRLLVGAAAVVALGFSMVSPCLRGLISQDTEAHSQGSVQGVAESVRGFGMTLGPLIGGWLFDERAGWPFLLGGACMLICCLVSGRVYAAHRETGRGLTREAPPADTEAEAAAIPSPR
ncbi:MAG TPA: MFS transporter [Armatimonadota bacterium]|nr:MFS transporter [Armatimonadota bacterium]